MGLLSTKENKDDLFSKILIYFDISITHPLQTTYKKYYAPSGFGNVGSFFFSGISVSITIIYFADINRPKQPGILVLSFSSNHISPNNIYIYL